MWRNPEDKAYQLYAVSTLIFVEGGFTLRKFVTNSVSLQQKIAVNPGHSESVAASNSDMEENAAYTSTLLMVTTYQKILGNSVSDTLVFDLRMPCKH